MKFSLGAINGTLTFARRSEVENRVLTRLFKKQKDIHNEWRCQKTPKADPNPPITNGVAPGIDLVHAPGFPAPPDFDDPDKYAQDYTAAVRRGVAHLRAKSQLKTGRGVGLYLVKKFKTFPFSIPYNAMLKTPYLNDHARLRTAINYSLFEFTYKGQPTSYQYYIALPTYVQNSISELGHCRDGHYLPEMSLEKLMQVPEYSEISANSDTARQALRLAKKARKSK